jgi:hypothetical protein
MSMQDLHDKIEQRAARAPRIRCRHLPSSSA